MSEVMLLEKEETAVEVKATESDCPELDFHYEKKPVFDFFKRLADIFLSLIALAFLLLPLLIVSIIIMCVDFGNPFFAHDRIGKDGKVFKIYKFRSMYKDAEKRKAELMEQNENDGALFKIKDDPRILGKFGKFIRRYSIDELPQLINILKGDMSIIGPRPFVPSEQELLSEDRLCVRPGLSCYWQINGKNSLSEEMSMYYDKKYIMDRSFATDIKIIFKTFAVVFKSNNS